MKNLRFFKLFGTFVPALLVLSCELALDAPLKEFFAKETGALTVQAVQTVPGSTVMGTDGFVCVNSSSGTTTITLPVTNPLGYDLDISVSEGSAAYISGAIVITLPAMTEGVDKTLGLIVKTKDGRLLLQHSIPVALVNFDVKLVGLSLSPLPSGAVQPVLVSGTYTYSVNPVAVDFTLTATPTPLASVSMSINKGGTLMSTGATTVQVLPPRYDSAVTIRISAPHGAKEQIYTLGLNRPDASNAALITSFSLGDAIAIPGGGTNNNIDHGAGTITLKGLSAGTILRDVDLTGKIQVSPGAGFSVTTGTGTHSKKAHFAFADYSAVNPVTITVTAEDGTTTKSYNVTVTRYPGVPTEVTITGLTVTDATVTGLTVSWTAPPPSTEVGSYELYASENDSFEPEPPYISITETTADIDFPSGETRYYIWVRACSAADPSLVGSWSLKAAGSGSETGSPGRGHGPGTP
jgi:hypothetical protein